MRRETFHRQVRVLMTVLEDLAGGNMLRGQGWVTTRSVLLVLNASRYAVSDDEW